MLLKKLFIFLCCISILSISLGCCKIKFTNKKSKHRKTFEQFGENKAEIIQLEEYKGEVKYGKPDDWKTVTSKFNISNGSYLKTSEDSYLVLKMPHNNIIKLYSNSNIISKSSLIELLDGELTSSISIEGREKLLIRISKINIIGRSGIFKVIYNKETGRGEIVVKNGLVEVIEDNQKQKKVLLNGFYKINFENNNLGEPTQTSAKEYEWK